MKNTSKIILGVLLLIIGCLVLLNNLGILKPYGISISFFWSLIWPIAFLGIGITLLLDKNIIIGTIFSLIGLTILANKFFNFNFWSTFWPLIIVGIGLSILFRKEKETDINSGEKNSNNDSIDDTVVFWGIEKKVTSKNFKGGEINTIFGGYQLDLRDCIVDKDGAILNINCAFGGVEVLVPKNCRIVTNGTGILGGWVPSLEPNNIDSPTLTIKGTATLGGVEIKN